MLRLNTIDSIGSIKFTFGDEEEVTLIVHKADGSVRYTERKHTWPISELFLTSPITPKIRVIKTNDRCSNGVTEDENRKEEQNKIQCDLNVCGYPKWSFK